MTQVLTTTMAATLRATIEGLKLVDEARCKKGWSKKAQVWADFAEISPTTLGRFWGRIPIRSEAIRKIYLAVGIKEWEELVSAEDCKTRKQTAPAYLKKRNSHAVITLGQSLDDISPEDLHRVITILAKYGVSLIDQAEGSLKLLVEGSSEDIEKINAMFQSGELSASLSMSVQSVQGTGTNKLAEWIRESDGEDLCLSYANLGGASLSGASLSYANLSYAYLSNAYLSNANLSYANLRGASLSNANLRNASLRGADLRGADLCRANLCDVDLRGANLCDVDLRGANLSRANVTYTRFSTDTGFSEEAKQDLIRRGAIFEDALGDYVFSPAPSGRR